MDGEKLNFTELAAALGGTLRSCTLPDGREVQEAEWTDELARKTLDYFRAKGEAREEVGLEGHPDAWLMMAIIYLLRHCPIRAYLGPLGKSLYFVPYRVGAPREGQCVTFEVREAGEDVFLTVVLGENPDPFAMPLGDIGAPEIPAGKNLYVDLKGAHYLFNFPLPLTYGDACRSMYMIQDGSYVCCISHTPEVQVGDRVPV